MCLSLVYGSNGVGKGELGGDEAPQILAHVTSVQQLPQKYVQNLENQEAFWL